MVEIILVCVFTTASCKLDAIFLLALAVKIFSSYVLVLFEVVGRLNETF